MLTLPRHQQVLYDTIQDIVAEYDGADHDRYSAAAADFRMPYWDWATTSADGQTVLPDSISAQTVTVTSPTGEENIDNPLYSYRFHPLSSTDLPDAPVSCDRSL